MWRHNKQIILIKTAKTMQTLIQISLKFVSNGTITGSNEPALILIMNWRRIGDMSLFESVLA